MSCVSDVLRGCYEDVSDFQMHLDNVDVVSRVANMSTTSRACRARGIWRTTRQIDRRATKIKNYHGAEFPELFLERTCSLW